MFGEDLFGDLKYALSIEEKECLVLKLREFAEILTTEESLMRVNKIVAELESVIKWEKERKNKDEEIDIAMAKGKSTTPKNKWGVHEIHCCITHGCKYGDRDCPVTMGLTKQNYLYKKNN